MGLFQAPSQGRQGVALWGLGEGRQPQSLWPTASAPARPHRPEPVPAAAAAQASLYKPGKSNGYSSFLARTRGAKAEGKGKKVTTNVPPIVSHGAELLFLPCWILPFPWYFPSSRWQESQGHRLRPRLCQHLGTGTTPALGMHRLKVQLPPQQVFLTSAPQAYMAAGICHEEDTELLFGLLQASM